MGHLYTKMKIFHFKEKVDSLPETIDQIMAPIHIRIKPTNACAHSCWYCAYKADNLQLGKDMVKKDLIPKEKMMEIIDDIVEMGVKAVTFSGGGDPFYYPYLLDTVKKLSETQVKFASLTNGSTLSGALAEVFAHYGTWIRISIDGWDDESYSIYRGVKKGEFTKVMKNMESFKKLEGACHLGVSIIVDKKNASHIYDFIRKLKNIGVDNVKVSPGIVSNEGRKNNEYHRSIFSQVKEQTKKAIEDLDEENFEIFDSYHELDEKFEKEYNWCPYLQILPVIGADLNIYPCQDKAYNLDDGLIGSIKNQRFKDFWFSDKENFFKINPSSVCNHHCVANTKNKLVLEYLDSDREHLGFV
ncbi:MAG: radical SAM protein [Spirochaetales bacterium]|jgi:MoaA/NifB/PqqE/SkfB family radical SAM enzyme|nr:radical SAM protein [Spirochaetales bacterium]|tara:strand:+ start:5355 stop:6425 length:1071 start_codon:yes stop_codon:yes gene_type:complete